MALEKCLLLREAERVTGINRHTLKLWLETDLGLVFPSVHRGSKFLVFERDLETVLRMRAPLAIAEAS